MDIIQHKKTGFWLPANSGSESAIREAYLLKDYGGLPSSVVFKGKKVMDCGAHIGTFSLRALEEGASRVYAYEPFPACVEALNLNLTGKPAEIIPKALVKRGEGGKTLDFHYREERLEGASLLHKGANQKRWNYQTMTVATVDFWNELQRIKPNILKMDIEGVEWDIIDEPLPDFVEALFIEVHGLYSKGPLAALDFIERIFPNSTKISHVELVPFKSKPDKVTNVSALYSRQSAHAG
jgi:FkbM family methyltransferase